MQGPGPPAVLLTGGGACGAPPAGGLLEPLAGPGLKLVWMPARAVSRSDCARCRRRGACALRAGRAPWSAPTPQLLGQPRRAPARPPARAARFTVRLGWCTCPLPPPWLPVKDGPPPPQPAAAAATAAGACAAGEGVRGRVLAALAGGGAAACWRLQAHTCWCAAGSIWRQKNADRLAVLLYLFGLEARPCCAMTLSSLTLPCQRSGFPCT